MTHTLVLGGTAWLGREVALAALEAGHEVTCLARGQSGPVPDGARLVSADRSLPGAYDAVSAQDWDAIIDVSYNPIFIAEALAAVGSRTRHLTVVSSVSVYSSNDEPDADETADVVDPIDLEDYAHAKVASELAATEAIAPESLLIVRPGLIGGPGDGSDRFSYWVARFAEAGNEPVLVPVTTDRAVQVIDVRDLAEWIIAAGGAGTASTINAVGDSLPLSVVLDRAAVVAGFSGETVSASDSWLREHEVNYWAGPRSLPLWLPVEDAGFAQRSNMAFRAAGGATRSLDTLLTDSLADERQRGLSRARRSGLDRADELVLLAELSHN